MNVRPGYKQTEVGVIPADWNCSSVAQIALNAKNSIVGGPFGSDLVSNDYVSTGVPVIRGQNMGGHYLSGDFVFVSKPKAKNLQANTARAGDLIFTQRGTLGQVSIVPSEPFGEYIVSQSQMKLTLNPIVADTQYIYQYFSSIDGQKQVTDSAIQTGVPHTNLGILKAYKVPLPPMMAEQRAIATALSDVDALLDGLERIIAKKRDLKQAATQQLLTGQTRLPGFQNEWATKRLGEVANFYKGKGLPKSALTSFGSEPCIHYGELFTQYGETIRETISRTDNITNVFRSVANDVLMPTSDVTPRGLAKASCVVIDDVVLGGDILVIRTNPALICGTFLSHVIRREEDQVLRLVTGTTVFHLYGTDMAKFTFKLPQLAEQQAIVGALSDMDTELSALEARRDKTRALKQAMMQELLTGKTRLIPTGDANA